ncbi:MAG: DUF1007 family protein [Hyphomicrobiales bacterium]
MIRFILWLGFLLSGVSLAFAHPHVWLQAKADLIFDDDNNFVAVRHTWEFDEGFSAFATQGLDENGDGKFSREELAELASINVDSLKDFEYFTFVQIGEKDPPYEAPTDQWLEYNDGLLTLRYTLNMEKPVAPDPVKGFQELTVEVFDATFFVDVSFVEKNAVSTASLGGGETACTASLERRKELDIIQSQLLSEIPATETVPEELAPEVGDLSNTIRITCPSS